MSPRWKAGTAVLLTCLPACATLQLPASPLPPPATPPTTDAPTPGSGARHARLEAEVHAQINAYRATRGLPPLRHDDYLAHLARQHSDAMAKGRRPFGHHGFEGRAADARRHHAISEIAENVAYDNRIDLVAQVVRGWIGSPGHHANIVGGFNLTGVGVARSSSGVFYFTQLFATRR